MAFDPTRPYNDLPNLPPPAELETRLVLKACVEARVKKSKKGTRPFFR
jgi:hypothetical protein